MPADPKALHDAENADFSAYLHTLKPEEWDRMSLCDGWMVRVRVSDATEVDELMTAEEYDEYIEKESAH